MKISQLSELLHVVDAVKNMCRERLERDSWRQGGVRHSGSRNSGIRIKDKVFYSMKELRETCYVIYVKEIKSCADKNLSLIFLYV